MNHDRRKVLTKALAEPVAPESIPYVADSAILPKKWYEQRTGKPWPEDSTHYEHPRPLKDGGDPLFVEPGFCGPNAPHMIPGPDGLTDSQRWGRLGGRPPKQ